MHPNATRVLLLSVALSAPGCCFTPPTPVTAPPVIAPPVVPPPGVPPPVVVPPAGTIPTTDSSMAMCLQLCERAGHCLDTRGVPRTPETADCNQACTMGHTYGSLPPQAFACLNTPTCVIFESCVEAAMGAALAGMPAGMPPPGMPPTGTAPAAPGAPPGWPDGFPVVPGGTPMAAPPAGPVRVAILAYPDMAGADLDARYHAELAAAGWTAPPAEAGPEARRFSATRGTTTVSISIYEEGGQAFIQTMQF
jgi:hypothetical protein